MQHKIPFQVLAMVAFVAILVAVPVLGIFTPTTVGWDCKGLSLTVSGYTVSGTASYSLSTDGQESAEVRWGDGSTTGLPNGKNQSVTVSHTYGQPGSYYAALVVIRGTQERSCVSQVTIEPPATETPTPTGTPTPTSTPVITTTQTQEAVILTYACDNIRDGEYGWVDGLKVHHKVGFGNVVLARDTAPVGHLFYSTHADGTTTYFWIIENNGVYGCQEEIPPTSVPVILYEDCEPKALVTRYNRNSVPSWDPSDIIGIKNVESSERELWNVSESWGNSDEPSFEDHPSLSWDGCWFAMQRIPYGEGTWTIWWDDFSGMPTQVLVDGQPVYGTHPEVGPLGEIVFRDMSGHLWMTDRFGSFLRDLRHDGKQPDFDHTGELIRFVDPYNEIHTVNKFGYTRSTQGTPASYYGSHLTGGLMVRNDPAAARLFFIDNFNDTGSISIGIWEAYPHRFDWDVLPAQDIAQLPWANQSALLIQDGALTFTAGWDNMKLYQPKLVADPWAQPEAARWAYPEVR